MPVHSLGFSVFRIPYTDFIHGTEGEDGLSGPVDLPAGADQPDQLQNDQIGDESLSPVVAEVDNFLLEQSLDECKKVRLKSAICRQASHDAVYS